MTDTAPEAQPNPPAVPDAGQAQPAETPEAPPLAEGGTEPQHAQVDPGTAVTSAGAPLPGEVNPPAVTEEVAKEPDEVPNFEPGPWSYNT